MLFEYRYFGNTAVKSGSRSSALSFAPDTRRDPTFFRGAVGQALGFREVLSALHDVVVSDLRFKPKDRTEYMAWLAKQEELDWAMIGAQREETRRQLVQAQAELQQIRARRSSVLRPFWTAQQRYFKWLLKKNYTAWLVLDPVITVHPDEVSFECFSKDESSYGRVACRHEVFRDVGEMACGTTNIDYSDALYDQFQKIRTYKTTTLQVDPGGFEVATGDDEAFREVKIDLPDSWVRGFLQVSAAMTLPAVRFDLHPMDVHNLCFVLRRARERKGPRSIRFHLEPGQPVRAVMEPWGVTIDCPRSPYTGDVAQEIRVWGRRRLHILERLIPVADTFTVTLLGTGMPSFWEAHCGDLHFTLGLSGWTANDWSKQGNFDLLAPRAEVDHGTSKAVFDALGRHWFATDKQLSDELQLDKGTVVSSLIGWVQAGRVIFDLQKGVWRKRELAAEPLDMRKLRWANEREQQGAELAMRGAVTHRHARVDGQGHTHLEGRVSGNTTRLQINPDQRLVDGSCSCRYFFQNKLKKGPCEHLLALRLAHERGIEAAPEVVPSNRGPVQAPPPPERRPTARQRAAAERTAAVLEQHESERFLALLEERELVLLSTEGRADFVDELCMVFERYDVPEQRLGPMAALFADHGAVLDYYFSDEELSMLLEQWG